MAKAVKLNNKLRSIPKAKDAAIKDMLLAVVYTRSILLFTPNG